MRVRIVATHADSMEGYPVTVGDEYDVYGVRLDREGLVVDILYPESWMLLPLPGEMVEVADGSIPRDWLIDLADGRLVMGPEAALSPFFHDRLSDGEPDAVAALKEMIRNVEEGG